MTRLKPGPGWKEYDKSPVWENRNGTRVHILGMIRSPAGHIYPVDPVKLDRLRKIVGGSRKRALMVMANLFDKNLNNT